MPDPKFLKVLNYKAGWYCGDFHTHTHASDGIYPADILAGIAKAEGLDFIAITDHNTIAGLQELSDNLDFLVIPGLEITFNNGHFNSRTKNNMLKQFQKFDCSVNVSPSTV